jgi:virginiamycin B lyase
MQAHAAAGSVTQFPLPTLSAYPGSITTGPDGALWFAETGKIGRMTTSGALTEFALPSGRTPNSIRSAPDGTLWFTESSAGRIGHLTTGGAITEYLVPGACLAGYSCPTSPRPQSITAGGDGALWFTETIFSNIAVRVTGSKVVRFSPPSSFTEYVLPSGGTKATTPVAGDIVQGADGALWFTDSRQGRIWRITTAGSLSFSQVPLGSPQSLTTGPGAALWFSAAYGNGGQIGKLTTSGAFTEFTVPVGPSGSSIGAITAGPDGNLWFAGYDLFNSAGTITRVTPAGQFTTFHFSTYVEIDGLGGGPDGGVWFSATNNQTGQSFIGRMATS